MSRTTPPRILIVEDNRTIARDLEAKLARLGYAIAATTAFAEQAVELAEHARPDLVLMDIRLEGEMSGITAAEQIRARWGTPVVFLTSFSDDDTLAAARVAEPLAYVVKPVTDRELRTVLEMALYKHASERERARLELQLRRAEKLDALGRLAGGVAHDFNNVLMAILSNCRALEAELPPGHARVANIRSAAERAARMTSQLLAFGRDDPEAPAALDLGAHVTRTVAMLADLIDGVRVEVAIGAVQAVRGHSSELEQVVMNLLLNARDAMPGGGTVAISARDDGDWVLLSVADTGTGMDEATRARIFEPFFTTKPLGAGTGLGLATVHAIVERGGGRVEVASELGRGTTFTVWLPATRQIPVEHAPAAAPPIELAGTLVVVEDDVQVRTVIRDILEQAGLTVLEATDGLDALRVCRTHPGAIDLVLSDVMMPRLGGADLARSLAADAPGTRIIYMSGGLPGPRAAELGPILHKPFTPGELLAWIRDALQAPPGDA